jgi:probable F420-dependent oxidoreductase
MEFDVMTRATTWDHVAGLARRTEAAGFSGMLFTEGQQVPWMNIAAAALAAPSLHFSTGIAIAFARSPMISAQIAWELAQNTRGKFRLGLGSQVKAHITRRYASTFDKPAPQMKDYVKAVKACLKAFRREGALEHDGPYYKLSLLTEQWTPSRHAYEDIKVDISAVGPFMVRVAGEVADGVHVHPMHSMHYIRRSTRSSRSLSRRGIRRRRGRHRSRKRRRRSPSTDPHRTTPFSSTTSATTACAISCATASRRATARAARR